MLNCSPWFTCINVLNIINNNCVEISNLFHIASLNIQTHSLVHIHQLFCYTWHHLDNGHYSCVYSPVRMFLYHILFDIGINFQTGTSMFSLKYFQISLEYCSFLWEISRMGAFKLSLFIDNKSEFALRFLYKNFGIYWTTCYILNCSGITDKTLENEYITPST